MFNILKSISFRTGSSYWTVNGFRIKGWGQKITSFGFPASVDHIDAAVYIPDTGHTLFFTQDQYWRYDINVQESCIIVCTSYLFSPCFLRYNENQKALEKSNPRFVSDDFPGIKLPISAAVYKRGG